MESRIIRELDYRLTVPTSYAFLIRMLGAEEIERIVVVLSSYVLDGTLQSYGLLKHRPSLLAAAAVYVARRTTGLHGWTPALASYTTYDVEEVKPVAEAVLAEKRCSGTSQLSVDKKYSSEVYRPASHVNLCL